MMNSSFCCVDGLRGVSCEPWQQRVVAPSRPMRMTGFTRGPRPLAGGRFCVIRDPAGAVCALYEPAP